MIGLPGQCTCKCHQYGSEIKDCKCGCQQCPYCNRYFILGLVKYHIDICKPYYENGLNKIKKDEKQCGC